MYYVGIQCNHVHGDCIGLKLKGAMFLECWFHTGKNANQGEQCECFYLLLVQCTIYYKVVNSGSCSHSRMWHSPHYDY